MNRIVFAAAVAAFALSATSAVRADDIPSPPAVLSPDLNGAWLVQLMPGKMMAKLRMPRNTRQSLFAPPLITVPPDEPQPTLINVPGDPPADNYPLPREFQPQVVRYQTSEQPGTIVIDTPTRHLFLVLDGGKALRYGVGVGKPGFEWAGVHTITRKQEWPDWTPPPEMLARRPDLPRHMDGGVRNPLGARALYLGSTLYRIHGSNEPWTIGHAVSSGCIRMRNQDVEDLYNRVGVGTKVIVI